MDVAAAGRTPEPLDPPAPRPADEPPAGTNPVLLMPDRALPAPAEAGLPAAGIPPESLGGQEEREPVSPAAVRPPAPVAAIPPVPVVAPVPGIPLIPFGGPCQPTGGAGLPPAGGANLPLDRQQSQPATANPTHKRPIMPATGFLPIGIPFPVKSRFHRAQPLRGPSFARHCRRAVLCSPRKRAKSSDRVPKSQGLFSAGRPFRF